MIILSNFDFVLPPGENIFADDSRNFAVKVAQNKKWETEEEIYIIFIV